MKDFDHFKKSCLRAESGDVQKLAKLLSVKKFFAIPWLICGDILLRELN